MTRIFHTADLHLGLKFTRGGYPPDLRDRLVSQRLQTLEKMVAIANERKCHLFAIAGDLFDTPRMAKGLVRQTAEILNRFEGVVAVLPGNHDYAQDDDPLWAPFADTLAEGHHLLQRETPCDLTDQGIPLVLFPGVCGSRHSKENAVAWVSGALAERELGPGVRPIGIAHGSLEGLSPDFNGDYFPMSSGELKATGMDAWLLGHTHIRFPDRESFSGTDEERVFFPATPEPDGFDCRHGGHAWILEIDGEGHVAGTSVETGTFRFRHLAETLGNEADLDALKTRFASFDPNRDLVKLTLTGRLAETLFEAQSEWLSSLEEHCLYLETDLTNLLKEIRLADIRREFTEGSFPYQLLSHFAGDDDDQTTPDPEALQLAWDLVKEAQP